LQELTAELVSDAGPGSNEWQPETSATNRINEIVLQALRNNNGQLPGDLEGAPFLIITATGAKSGKMRSVPLTYIEVDQRIVIIASMGGAKFNPPWYHNLLANPEVQVERDGNSYLAEAVVTKGDDRNHLFKQACEAQPTFAEYQARTDRVIPVVELIAR